MIRSHAREFREAIFPFCNPPRVVSVRNGTYFWRNLTLPRCHLPRHDDSSLHRTEKKKKKERKEGKNSTVFSNPRFVQSRMVEPCTGREEIGSASEQFITREGKWSRNLRFFAGLVELPVTTSLVMTSSYDLSLETIFLFINARLATR